MFHQMVQKPAHRDRNSSSVQKSVRVFLSAAERG